MIHKIRLSWYSRVLVTQLPIGYRILTAQIQTDEPVVWYECDPHSPTETVTFYMVWTGESAPPGSEYIGTLQYDLVYHIYVRRHNV